MPFELENGTDYIGLEIADQLWLENDAPSGGIKWPRCCCQAPATNATLTVHGCNSAVLANTAIQFWTSSGGTLLFTLTTNSSGEVSLSSGTYWVIPGSGRFAGQTKVVAIGTNTITCAAATGYACCTAFSWPIATTVYITDATGTHTLSYNATNVDWEALLGVTGNTQSPCAVWTNPFVWTCSNTASVPYYYNISCVTAGSISITRIWYATSAGTYCTDSEYVGSTVFGDAVDAIVRSANPSGLTGPPFAGSTTLTDQTGGDISDWMSSGAISWSE